MHTRSSIFNILGFYILNLLIGTVYSCPTKIMSRKQEKVRLCKTH